MISRKGRDLTEWTNENPLRRNEEVNLLWREFSNEEKKIERNKVVAVEVK